MAAPAAATGPARRLLLLLRLGNPPPLPVPLVSHLTPQFPHPPPAPAPPLLPGSQSSALSPDPSIRDLLFSFHPSMQIYPSLVEPRGDDVREEGGGGGGGTEVWADSVKKKRKRKMNKHKLRKLRKRLRRQT
ncbi:putative beta-hexosaminidase [Brachypodium distachyon]|uniref:Small ribosomal subunit protein mS38 n=1 Tax=Brachypodium distachyon TaxID=15368 RepID=I1ISX6_BRADI|nr:putative beta-hexosaminidase [Brachypodium distachyon]KQJ91526.1 hypothetical protein BRADI_4g38220v3 [Brachypodium distachyon]|eukprot:XP_010238519.1 putative beta-hexosaminidase [Brachypodium distachyon]